MLKRIAGSLLLLASCSPVAPDVGSDRQAAVASPCASDPRVELGLVTRSMCEGAELFFRGTFGGNGRSCATCHPAAHNFTIDPDFIASLPPDDPLFVAESAPALSGLERPALMRGLGLILENIDGADDPTHKFVMRSVPHCFSLATSLVPATNDGTTLPPNERTGWSGDGAPGAGTLRDFQTGAVFQHYTRSLARSPEADFVLPVPAELDEISEFLHAIGRTNELDLAAVSLPDPSAEAGRLVFLDPAKRCNGCHHNAGANNGAGVNRNFDTGVEAARPAILDAQGIPRDGGFGRDPLGGALGDGTFNTPPLIEAADTGPFFHNNARGPTIEDAIQHYRSPAFAASPAGNGQAVSLSDQDVADVGAFLRTLNASFNVQVALARAQAAAAIVADRKNHDREIQQGLGRLALIEVDDALADLTGAGSLSPAAQARLVESAAALGELATRADPPHRASAAASAIVALQAAQAILGSGLTMSIAPGVLLF